MGSPLSETFQVALRLSLLIQESLANPAGLSLYEKTTKKADYILKKPKRKEGYLADFLVVFFLDFDLFMGWGGPCTKRRIMSTKSS